MVEEATICAVHKVRCRPFVLAACYSLRGHPGPKYLNTVILRSQFPNFTASQGCKTYRRPALAADEIVFFFINLSGWPGTCLKPQAEPQEDRNDKE